MRSLLTEPHLTRHELTRAAPAAIDSDVVLRAAAADSDDGGLSAAARIAIAIAIAGLALAWQRRGRASS